MIATGILELDELTMREYERLPLASMETVSSPYIRVEWMILLNNPLFNGRYFGYVIAGDFGWYRLTDLGCELVPERRKS